MDFDFLEKYKKLQLKTPRLSSFILNSENSDYNYNVKDLKNCYLLANAINDENCMYGRDFYGSENCTDCDHIKNCTLCYQCLNCQNCFGCISLHRKQYYILNQPYEKDEYFKKVSEIKNQLKEQGLYGEMFIPPAFPREDTVVVWATM